MKLRSVFVQLCFIIFTVISQVELTPIVTLPPESVPTTTENLQSLTTSTEASVSSVVRLNVTVVPEEEDGLSEVEGVNANATTTGQIETTTNLPVILKVTDNISNETVVQAVVALSTTEIANQTAEEEEPTTPELILNTTTSTASTPYIEVTQLSVTSNPITLKSGSTTVQVDKLLEATLSTFSPVGNQTTSVTTSTNSPVRIISVSGNASNETEGDYKSKAPPEYHPYIEEILRGDTAEDNDTSAKVSPIRIKSKGYQSSHNDLNEHPYGPLPKFEEKEMNKLRLNHWRVHQLLKGDVHQDTKVGRPAPGTVKKDNNNMQSKYQQHLSNFLGQKRASSASVPVVVTMKSSIDQDEFHSSILAAEHDGTAVTPTEEPTKLRSFFNWISSPLKKAKSSGSSDGDEDDERLKQARKQEPILPFALGYRGDFLFW